MKELQEAVGTARNSVTFCGVTVVALAWMFSALRDVPGPTWLVSVLACGLVIGVLAATAYVAWITWHAPAKLYEQVLRQEQSLTAGPTVRDIVLEELDRHGVLKPRLAAPESDEESVDAS